MIEDPIQRMNEYRDSFFRFLSEPRRLVYPGLSADAWLATGRIPELELLEIHAASIRAEVVGLDATAYHGQTESLIKRSGSWEVFMLLERGRRISENCALLPATVAVLDQLPVVDTFAGLVYCSRMRPGTHIEPHRGPTNIRVRCHLPLEVPNGDAAISVSGTVRRWEVGRALLFNDFLEHEAWNNTVNDRVVLVIDLWHPDLTTEEVVFLRELQRYAGAHATDLHEYWSANHRERERVCDE